MESKTCKQCGFTFIDEEIEIAFQRTGRRRAFFRICRHCRQERRTEKRRQNRWLAKARDTINRHSKRLDIDRDVLVNKYGWNAKTMAHEAEHQYLNGCSQCHEDYKLMGSGLADITLDIWDRSLPPEYEKNTRWVCNTCNLAKGIMTPYEWMIYTRLWRKRDEFLQKHQDQDRPWSSLPLFHEEKKVKQLSLL